MARDAQLNEVVVAAELGGGKFGNGFATAAFGYLFNEAGHTILQSGDKSLAMNLGEALRGSSVRSLVAAFNGNIEDAASAFGVDANLIRAIIFEEQTKLFPVIESGTAERLGIGTTVGLGQVTVGLHGFTRQQLLDPATNIRAIATHLSFLAQQPLINLNFPTASLATSYNCGSCTSITSYGRRVDSYYQDFRGER